MIRYRFGPRPYCIDMGGFAFDGALLRHMAGTPWNYTGRAERYKKERHWRGGEPELAAAC